MNYQKKKNSKWILSFGTTSLLPIILLFFIWLTLTLTTGWQNDGAAMFSLGVLFLSLLLLGPISIIASIITIIFWFTRDKSKKNTNDTAGLILSIISTTLVGIFFVLVSLSYIINR